MISWCPFTLQVTFMPCTSKNQILQYLHVDVKIPALPPHCPWCSEALGNPISTPIYDQIVLEGAGPAGLDQLRVSGWSVYLQRLGHLIFLSNSAHEFTLVETPTKQQLPCLFFQSLSSISPPPQQQKNRQHNPLPTSLWAHLPQPFHPCLFPSHRPDPHGEGNTFAIQDFEAITLHSLRSVPHHTTMDLLSYQKHRFRIRYNKCSVLRCLI